MLDWALEEASGSACARRGLCERDATPKPPTTAFQIALLVQEAGGH